MAVVAQGVGIGGANSRKGNPGVDPLWAITHRDLHNPPLLNPPKAGAPTFASRVASGNICDQRRMESAAGMLRGDQRGAAHGGWSRFAFSKLQTWVGSRGLTHINRLQTGNFR